MAASCSTPDFLSKHTEWMANLPEELHDVSITKLAIPGTHDSFAFHLTHRPGPDLIPTLRRLRIFIYPIIKNWSITQNKDFTEQLNLGIRYFDLRVCPTVDQHLHKKSPFTFTHGLLGHLVGDGLEEINKFLDKHPKEIVLLDFNHFHDFNEQCGHDQLIHLIHEIFGRKLCTTARTINECTLNHLWSRQQQVILLYEKHADQCSAYMDRIGHFFQVCESPWPNVQHPDRLFTFLDEKIATSRPTNCINVIQGQLTPDGTTIQRNPFSSLYALSRETNERLIPWLQQRQRDPSVPNGINVVICDFANELYADTVILLNYK